MEPLLSSSRLSLAGSLMGTRLFRGVGGNPLDLGTLDFACLVQVVLQLHACPKFGARAKGGTETVRHIWRNARNSVRNPRKRDASNAKGLRCSGDRHIAKVLSQHFARMWWLVHAL